MDRTPYQRRNYPPRRNFYPISAQGSPRYSGGAGSSGVAKSRIFDNAVGEAQKGGLPSQARPRINSESEKAQHNRKSYSFENFPIEMDNSEIIICERYAVSLLQQPRFNAIFIRAGWSGRREITMCGMIEFGSSESVLRHAVKECINKVEQCDYLVRQGERYPISECSVEYLNKHHIVVMDKVDGNFPHAVYWCTLCDYHMSSIQHVRSHFEQHEHFADEQRMREREDLLDKLPQMTSSQMEAINMAISQLLREGDDVYRRGPVWQDRMELMETVEKLLSRCVFEKLRVRGHVRPYGSTVTRTAIASSDLNVTIDIPGVDCSDAVETMKQVADLLNQGADGFEARFLAQTPMCIRLTMSDVCVRITWRRESGLKLGSLLATYAEVRPQFPELCRVVRKWAEISGIYSIEKRQGGLNSYGFDLMVLYFLQQRGLMPCLHEMRPMMAHEKRNPHLIDEYFDRRDLYENDIAKITEDFGALEEPWNLALLFVEFLRFFASRDHLNEVVQVVTKNVMTRDKTRWSRKLLQIADPFRTENVVTFTRAYQAYFFNCFLKSYLYFAIPQTTTGPMVDIKLYQKMAESPRKRRGKRRRGGPATPGSEVRGERRFGGGGERAPLSVMENAAQSTSIDEDEYTAAADALSEEQKEEVNNKIIENLMPDPDLLDLSQVVMDARVQGMARRQSKDDQAHLSVSCVNGLLLTGAKQDVMSQLIAIAKAATSGDAVAGCSIVDLPNRLCGSYMLPRGEAFFVPERSACGFLVNSRWTNKVREVKRVKKGICEITLHLSADHFLKILYCIQLYDTYPLRRLRERVEELKNWDNTSLIVMFGNEGEQSSERRQFKLAEVCENLGLEVWTGLFKEESRTFVAIRSDRKMFEVEDLAVEEIDTPLLKECYVVRAVATLNPIEEPQSTDDVSSSKEDHVNSVTAKMRNDKRNSEKKVERAERRRQEKERAAKLLEKFVEEEKTTLKKCLPGEADNDLNALVDDLISKVERLCKDPSADEGKLDVLSENATPKRKRTRNKVKFAEASADEAGSSRVDDKNVPCNSHANHIASNGLESSPKQSDNDMDNVDPEMKHRMETSLFYGIPLKDLNPINVEIDDIGVYSRRTMYKIRDIYPVSIRRTLFAILERLQLNSREFNERDKECEAMKERRRNEIRNARMRKKLRKYIGTEVKMKKVEMQGPNPFDSQGGITEKDWLPVVRAQVDDDDDDDELGLPYRAYANDDSSIEGSFDELDLCETTEKIEIEVEHKVEVETKVEKPQLPQSPQSPQSPQQDKENKPKPLICYEDFFITMKKFDPTILKVKIDSLGKESFAYSFANAQNFNNGYKPYMLCSTCESSEHWSDACPLMTIPKVETIFYQKKEHEWMELDKVIIGTYEKDHVKEHRIETIGAMVERIREFLENDLKKKVRLDIFGSLVNGLGSGSSDVDICFRFEENEPPLQVDGVEIVREICQSLQKMKGLDKVYAITTAKVPIVKFVCPKFAFEGDISYYNVLALYNTQLLRTYCAWDRRVAPVGIWVKRWAKSCDFGDASRGSLSSYAIIILLIHYLQNCDPPVLPRLQEDFRNGEVKSVMVENHDVYYHKTLPGKTEWSKNTSSVAQLFVGFLDYFARFDFETQVVQIRRRKPLLKMEKDWSRAMCIEDPFDLHHNLGSGVTKKMFVFIARNIHNSRRRFMLPEIRREFLGKKGLPDDREIPPNLSDNYAATLLKECGMGAAPSDRQCRICHRIGHFAEACPKLHDDESDETTEPQVETKDELVESDFRSQHGIRTPRKEPWLRKAPVGNNGETPPRGGQTQAGQTEGRGYQIRRSYYRKIERQSREIQPQSQVQAQAQTPAMLQ